MISCDYSGLCRAFQKYEQHYKKKLTAPIAHEIICQIRKVKLETAKRDLKDLQGMRYIFINQNREVDILI